jgi:RNA polymerase sigma-70 factor, ECF subfamily
MSRAINSATNSLSDYKNNETELINLSIKGDSKALNQLLARNEFRIHTFIKNKISREDDVNDVLQETFIQIHIGISNFQRRSRFATWALGITMNLVKNYYTRAGQNDAKFVSDEVLSSLSDLDNPEKSILNYEKIELLEEAINALPEEQRQVLQLVAFENFSYEEVAEKLGISISNIRSRLFRARKNLKELFFD